MDSQILSLLAAATAPLSSSELAEQLGVTTRTVQRALRELVDSRQVLATGKGRARRYTLAQSFETPTRTAAIGWDQDFLESYVPNKTFYLTADAREELRGIGAAQSTLPAGTYARRILDRLLIDLSWSSSRLEGNTYSLLDTEELLVHGRAPDGRTDRETQMVLNHKAAIEFLVEDVDSLAFDPLTVRGLHALLAQNLLADPAARGRLRTHEVRISGSSYIPLANPHRIESAFEMTLAKAEAIEDPFEAALFVLVQIPYLQPFVDVNKRVSRLAANIPLIRQNCYPISFLDTSQDEYVRAVLAIYERRDPSNLAGLFASSYRYSASKYAVITESIGAPDPLYLKYQAALKKFVPRVVRGEAKLAAFVNEFAKHGAMVGSDEVRDLERLIEIELASLHEGNAITYRLHPSELEAWRDNDSPR